MNILICDDQEFEARLLTSLLDELPEFDKEVKVFLDGHDALDYILSGASVDICFLDVMMPEMNGIELAEKLRTCGYNNEIVYITTTKDYAYESYRVKAFSYLLKPVILEDLADIMAELRKARDKTEREGISVKSQGVASFVKFAEVSHVEVRGHSVFIRLMDGSVIKLYSSFLRLAEELLKDGRFIQCHRSFLVNMDDIKTIKTREIILLSGSMIPISRGYSNAREKMVKWMFLRDNPE